MPGVVETATGKSLAKMGPEELRWRLLDRSQQLTHRERFTRRYLHRRAERSQQKTSTGQQFSRFQALAEDLLELLDSVVANIDRQTSL